MKKHTVIRDGELDLEFTGEEIATASSKDYPGEDRNRYWNYTLYRTEKKTLIAQAEYIGHWVDEGFKRSAKVCSSELDVIEYLGCSKAVKDLCHEAGISLTEKIEEKTIEKNTNNPFNTLSDAEAEALAWLAEEAAETIKSVTKILRFGLHSKNPDDNESGNDNRADLNREVGDMQAALCLCSDLGMISTSAVHKASLRKIKTVGKYLKHQNLSDSTWCEAGDVDKDGYYI